MAFRMMIPQQSHGAVAALKNTALPSSPQADPPWLRRRPDLKESQPAAQLKTRGPAKVVTVHVTSTHVIHVIHVIHVNSRHSRHVTDHRRRHGRRRRSRRPSRRTPGDDSEAQAQLPVVLEQRQRRGA